MDKSSESSGARAPYSQLIRQTYEDGLFAKRLPLITTDPIALEEQARIAMDQKGFRYISGGAGELATMDANRLAFRQWKLIPRVLQPCNPRDLTVKLFGHTYENPILMAPVGVQGLYHRDREIGLAEACAEIGVPYTLSTAATTNIEAVAEACGDHPRWYQLYWPTDNDITVSLLRRAKAAGYRTLVVTLDTPTIAWRPQDLNIANMPFLMGVGDSVGFSDPVFRDKFAKKSNGGTPETHVREAAAYWVGEIFSGEHHSWEDLEFLKKNWDGPIVLKGLQSVDDARLAVKYGIDGIIVSNHGGRQVDGSVGSLDMLPDIVEAVGGDLTVMFDSGIRTGTDIIKALALGAQAVFVGRPVLYGLGIDGKQGAKAVLAGLLADLDRSMGVAGFKTIDDLRKGILKRVQYGGDMKVVN